MAGDDNIVADTLSILPSTTVNWDKTSTNRDLSQENELFVTIVGKTIDEKYLLDLALLKQ